VFVVQFSIAVTVLTLSFLLLSPLGINGPGVAYLSGQGIVAVILLPSVVRQYRRPDMSPGFDPGAPLVTRSSGTHVSTDPAAASSEPEERLDDIVPESMVGVSEVPAVWRRRDRAHDGAGTSDDDGRDATRAGEQNPASHDAED
jgi:hypothetical protein